LCRLRNTLYPLKLARGWVQKHKMGKDVERCCDPYICLEVVQKTTHIHSQDYCSMVRDLMPGPPEYEVGVVTNVQSRVPLDGNVRGKCVCSAMSTTPCIGLLCSQTNKCITTSMHWNLQ
jgi:hypothetical protein